MLAEFGRDRSKARRAYRAYMAEGLGRKLDNPVSSAVHGLVLGSDAFVAKVRKLVGGRVSYPEVPHLGRLGRGAELGAMVGEVAERLKAERASWQPGRRSDDPARALCAYVVRRASGARLWELAAALGCRHPSAVTAASRRAEAAMRVAKVRREVGALVSACRR